MTEKMTRNTFLETRGLSEIGSGCGDVCVKRSDKYATLPTYGSDGAAGMDLYANLHCDGFGVILLEPGERRLFKTGISISIPRHTYARVAPRSGLAYKHGIDVMAGVIDEDYRGDVGVILVNLGTSPYPVSHGDRIAQLIIERYVPCFVTEVDSLPDTVRGSGKFGSTGV